MKNVKKIKELEDVLKASNIEELENSLRALMAYDEDLVTMRIRLHPRLEVEIGKRWVEDQPNASWGRTKNVKVFLDISQDSSGCGHYYQNIKLIVENEDNILCEYQRKGYIEVGNNFRGDRCNKASDTKPYMKWLR